MTSVTATFTRQLDEQCLIVQHWNAAGAGRWLAEQESVRGAAKLWSDESAINGSTREEGLVMASAERTAMVWASTWVPSKSPLVGFGEGGYAVAWVDTSDGDRLQVLVAGGSAPAPMSRGRLMDVIVDGHETVQFVMDQEKK